MADMMPKNRLTDTGTKLRGTPFAEGIGQTPEVQSRTFRFHIPTEMEHFTTQHCRYAVIVLQCPRLFGRPIGGRSAAGRLYF